MPLSLDTMLVQPSNSGSFNASSGAATLPTATVAGSTTLILIDTNGLVSSVTGHGSDGPTQGGNAHVYAYRRSNNPGGETSWTITLSVAALCRWSVYEIAGLDPDAPVDVVLANFTTNTASGTTASTGTTPRSTSYDVLIVALLGSYNSATTTPTTFSGHTNGFTEMDEGSINDGVSKAVNLSVAMATSEQLSTFETTATASATLSATNVAGGLVLVYSAQGAKRDANIAFFWGFKVGVGAAGLEVGNAGSRYFETIAGAPAITADGLQLASTSAAESVATPAISVAVTGVKAHVYRLEVRFDGSLPSVDTDLLVRSVNGSESFALRYRAASQKLGVQFASDTEQLSDATVTTGVFYGVDIRLIGTTTAWTADWQVDYGAGPVVQAQAAHIGASAMGTQPTTLGWAGAITVPGVTFKYLLVSSVAGHYPLGPYTIAFLKPDPAGTVTVSGTSSNFNTFTANGTMAAWNATTARDAIGEVPPTVGASADGLAQVTAAATDYVEIPMETYQAAPTGSIRAVRMCACGWAAAATAATIGFRGWEGSAETTLLAATDTNFDNTSTPAWVCKMYRPANGWTQAKLDGLAFRVGFSDDATPDIGIHAIYAEVAVQTTTTQAMFGVAGDVTVSASYDAVTGGVSGLATTAAEYAGAALHYEINSASTDVTVAAAGSRSDTLDAPDHPSTNYVAIYPDPQGVADT